MKDEDMPDKWKNACAMFDWKKWTYTAVGVVFSLLFISEMSRITFSVGGIASLIIGLVYATFAALAFTLGWITGATSGMTDFFLWNQARLKAPPEMLSPIKGMIEMERLDEAIEQLEEILAEKPFLPEPTLLLTELYFGNPDNFDQGKQLVKAYFANPELSAYQENIKILLAYCDYCQDYGNAADAVPLFEQELSRRGYSTPERRLLRNRLEAIKSISF